MQAVRHERDRLNIENLQKSEALAEESILRSEAEHRARVEAETKVLVFSEAVHHLNNPLNHIIGSNNLSADILTEHRHALSQLLHTEPPDEETEKVRTHFDQQLAQIIDEQGLIKSASTRASNTVALLRIVSGIDGIPTSSTPLPRYLAYRLNGYRAPSPS